MKLSETAPISIWQPRQINGALAFVRPDPYPLGDHYADRRVIFQQKPPGCARICFFGESVAAGYLYAPYLTPAKVLENQLAALCGEFAFEVIDLAKTNETLDHLVATVESALQLGPDLLVVFTGNNWTLLETPEVSPYRPSAEGLVAYARLLREAGLLGPVNQAARQVLEKAGDAFARIERMARTVAAKVILVIPETNLADWENRQPAHWMPGNHTARWYAHYQKSLQQLEASQWAAAEATAWEMEDLDGTFCPSTYRVLAKAFMGQGETRKARMACQAEVDANHYASLGFLGAPQINSRGQSLQRAAARHYGFLTVDLPEIFARHTGSPLPGRRMFLDYCHLTAEGMKVAMAGVTEKVLEATKHPNAGASWEALVRQLPDPAIVPAADATAKFGAAIHTAHRMLGLGPSQEMTGYWCREALKADPGIRQTMLDFVAARLSPIPAVLTVTQQRNFSSPYRLMMQHGWQYNFLDAVVIQAIVSALPLETAALSQFSEAFHPYGEGLELVHPLRALWNPVERFYHEAMDFRDISDRAFFRAAWFETSFALFGKPTATVSLDMSLRLPPIAGSQDRRSGKVAVLVNGKKAGVVQAGERWAQLRLLLSPSLFSSPLNRLTLQWPPVPPCGDAAIAETIHRLEQGLEADLHPVFGELFSLKV